LISRYLLRLHVVPFTFALSALTGILMVNQIAKRLKDLVGKGLPWNVIAEVFGLSVPFIVAMTLPMAVLVAVLYTMSRLTVDNELTALRAGGISLGSVARPLLIAGTLVAAFAFLFSDQVLPRTNHRLRTLLTDIARTKPTFGLEEQVINEVQRNRMFLRAGKVDLATFTLRDVTIVDLTDHNRKRVIYADSAYMAFAENQEDLYLTLFDGMMHETDRIEAENFQMADFRQDRIRVKGVGSNFSRTLNDTFRSDREMSVCAMDSVITTARRERWTALRRAEAVEVNSLRGLVGLGPLPRDTIAPPMPPRPYCRALAWIESRLSPTPLEAQEDGITRQFNEQARRVFTGTVTAPRINTARVLRDRARDARIRVANYLVELHKKYAISVACIVFVLVGIPAAIKFPRGGVGLVVGISLVVFTVYYVGLIAGESMANKLIIPPFWAMWTPNIVFAVAGVIALWRIRREATAGRGGDGWAWLRRWSVRS